MTRNRVQKMKSNTDSNLMLQDLSKSKTAVHKRKHQRQNSRLPQKSKPQLNREIGPGRNWRTRTLLSQHEPPPKRLATVDKTSNSSLLTRPHNGEPAVDHSDLETKAARGGPREED
ncbi:hypothetical protein YC2023_098078 [Brassica napus]